MCQATGLVIAWYRTSTGANGPTGMGPALEKDFLASTVNVELIVEPHGVPFAVSLPSGIPDVLSVVLGRDSTASTVLESDTGFAARFRE